MIRKITSYVLIFLLMFTCFVSVAYGATNTDALRQEQQRIEQEKKEASKKLAEGKAKEKQLNNQIGSIESKIKSTESDIANLQSKIKQAEENISKVQAELAKVEQEMKQQDDELNARLRAMYMKDNASFLEILLGSESIVDFMSNMDIIQRIYKSDLELLKTIEEQHSKIESQKKSLENLQAQLESDKQAEAAKRDALQSDKGQIVVLKQQVASENAVEEKNLRALAAAGNKITAELNSLMSTGTQYTGGQYTAGSLGWPLPGTPGSYRITSEFSTRNNPISGRFEQHLGMDIAAKSGTPVLAANSGTVIKAGYNSSYGYMVIIDHGGGIATLYAHNSRLGVSAGQSISKGQTISYVGSTGNSTGPHLHFEVRQNGKYTNPRGWLGI